MPKVITESDLVIPTLEALAEVGSAGLTTSELQPVLRAALQPTGQDLLLLEGRTDDRFSQKVRNLRSHQRLERDDLATFDGERYRITDTGRSYMKSYGGVDKSPSSQGFPEASKKNALSPSRPLKFVEEGDEQLVTRAVKRRSKRLRDFAVRYYSEEDGKIICLGCNFEATQIYGDDFIGLIEIHHLKPIALAGNTVKLN